MAKTKNCTICTVLNNHKEELFNLINQGNIKETRKRCLEIINDPCITDKNAVGTARVVFNKPNDNLFLSCLMTYMTCSSVS